MHDLWANLITERTKLTAAHVKAFFDRTVLFTADEALQCGLIEGIKDPIL
jgi:ATP-dependent protease ClpP protease subunit